MRITAIVLFSLICFIVFSRKDNSVSSFIWSSVAFLFITIVSALILLKSQKWIWFFVLSYLIKIVIGLLHYLYFIDPEYFQSGIYKSLTGEYDSAFKQIITFAHDKLQNGILFYQFYEGGVTHQEITSLISIPFVYFGDYILTIAPINAFSSMLISMNIILISKYKFNLRIKSLKYIALITAYFPMTLISSLLYRDIVGLALMSIGLALILFSKKAITQFLMLIIAAYLFYLQRTIYPFILIIAFLINSIINRKYKSNKQEVFYKVGILIASIILMPIIINYSINTEANESMANGAFNFNALILPVKLIIGLIGPFPWTQFLIYKTTPANAYQLQDYLQGTLNIAIVITIIIYWKEYARRNAFNLLNITGILIIISGLFNSFMHMTYVAIGFMFLIPWLFTQMNHRKFRKIYLYSFLALIILNIVVAWIGNLGISSSWK